MLMVHANVRGIANAETGVDAGIRSGTFGWDESTGRLLLARSVGGSSPIFVIVPDACILPELVVDGDVLKAESYSFNGEPVFHYGGRWAFCNGDDWILHSSASSPSAYLDEETGEWVGDGWWSIDPPDLDYPDSALRATARGTYANEGSGATAPQVRIRWPRWEWAGGGTAPFGYYDPEGGPTGRISLGLMRCSDGGSHWLESYDGLSFTRTSDGLRLSKISDGLWATDGYQASAAGSWYQTGAAPNIDSPATLAPMARAEEGRPAVADTSRDPITLTFLSFVGSQKKELVYMAEVAAWR